VGAAIGLSPDGLVNATDLARELDLANSRVRAQLLALCEGGYLESVPSLRVSEKKMYKRLDASLWKTCQELIERASRE
jgi:DNA-binding IclR family transcriptional regulator